MHALRRTFVALAFAAVAGTAWAEPPLPYAQRPEDVGLSSARLANLEAVTQGHIDSGVLPGAVMLVARRGKIAWTRTMGYRDRDAGDAMQPDSIFRIYSMSKPIVSVAAMLLVEEGRMQITDPVARILPEIGRMKVAVEKPAEGGGKPTFSLTEPGRPMTVQDLLRHTSGLIYGARGTSAVNAAYVEANLGDRDATNETFVTRLSALPLRFSPGTRWEYGVSTDVLGRVVEVVSGRPLGEFLSERILRPLDMVDTSFYVPGDKVKRAAQPWQRVGGPAMTPRFDVSRKPRRESGGGGLVSTMDDYLRFATMLLNDGEFDGEQILGRKTIEFMTADHVQGIPGRPPGLGFGLGFEVRRTTGMAGLPGTPGEYGWSGNAGTIFWIDPKEDLIAIYMVQVSEADRVMLRNQFRTMVQAAIID
jgi:CubicO group peptidase (beta-lactamase class C family)